MVRTHCAYATGDAVRCKDAFVLPHAERDGSADGHRLKGLVIEALLDLEAEVGHIGGTRGHPRRRRNGHLAVEDVKVRVDHNRRTAGEVHVLFPPVGDLRGRVSEKMGATNMNNQRKGIGINNKNDAKS